MKKFLLLILAVLMIVLVFPVAAEDEINYISQPDELVVFLNNIAYARDTIRIPGAAEARIVLPAQMIQSTLIVREGEGRVPQYRINYTSGTSILVIGASSSELRDITLEYLTSGISWKPTYDMAFSQIEGNTETVDFHFFAEIQNQVFALDGVQMTLAAGYVSATQQVDDISLATTNQYIAGYADGDRGGLNQGAVTIQYTYPLEGGISAQPMDALYTELLGATLPARRLLLWNANQDQQVSVIYKVSNTSDVPLAEGIVRSFQDGLFVGSDFIEFTPLGSEGSVTVGGLKDVRVNRGETITYEEQFASDRDTLHAVTLTMENFTANPIALEVVDVYPSGGSEFEFSVQPEFEAGNLLRWQVTLPPNETVEISYSYRSP